MIRRSRPTPDLNRVAGALMVLWGWRRLATAMVAGAVSALAFAPLHAFPVLWLSLPVVVWLLDGTVLPPGAGPQRWTAPAAVGWAFGFGFFLAGMWWTGAALLIAGGVLAWLAPLAALALASALALFWAAGFAAMGLVWPEGWPRLAVFATVMAAVEWLRGHLLTGLPWNAFGYALAPHPVMMQSAALVGVWGLTLAAFFVFAAPAALAGGGEERRGGMIAVAAALVLLVAHAGYGALRLAVAGDVAGGTAVRIVQPAVSQEAARDASAVGDLIGRYAALSGAGGPPGTGDAPSVVVWPESAFPFYLVESPVALTAIADLLPAGSVLVTGAARRDTETGGEPAAYNAVFVLDDSGEVRGAYDKVHLVPFGEYLPLRPLFEAVGLTGPLAIPGGFVAGARRHTLDIPGGPAIAPLVCFEAVFPGAVTEPGMRPDWLVNVTNDAWFGATPGPSQHFHQVRLRAVEEGLPLVRAANTGISAVVDPYGRVVARLPFDRPAALDAAVPPALSPTPYARFGDIGFFALILASVAALVGYFAPRWRDTRKN